MLRYILLPLLAISASAFVLEHHLCKEAGFFATIDNARTFIGCYPKKQGGFTLKVLTCPAEQVFSAEVGHCVMKMNFKAADIEDYSPIENPTTPSKDSSSNQPDIENPTVPTQSTTENFNDSTDETTEATEATEEPAETTAVTDEPSESTDEPTESTDKPSEPTESTDEPSEPTESTDEPSESTDEPTESTDEPSEPTEEPSKPTDEPTETTEEPGTTEEPETTGEPETTNDQTESTDETTNTTDEPTTTKPYNCPTKGFFPDSESCNKFIYCMPNDADTEPIELTCPEKQNFNPITLFCDANYECVDGEDVEIVAQIEFDCVMEGIFPDHKDQAKYFICTWHEKSKSFKYEHKTCAEKEIFHRLTGKCGRHIQVSKTLLHLGHH